MARRRALVVAIDDYGSPRNNLNSCVNDAQHVAEKLGRSLGFEVRMLLDGEATVQNVSQAIDALFQDVGQDDRLVFYYSGHGYQVQNQENREEVLVLRDGFLQDDLLSQKSQAIPEGTLTVVLDSCFSGGMEKMLIPGVGGFEVARIKRWIPDDKQVQEENAALERARHKVRLKTFGARKSGAPEALRKDFGAAAPTFGDAPILSTDVQDEASQLRLNGLLISACLENETAAAGTPKTNNLSAFTFGALETLRNVDDPQRLPPTRRLLETVKQRLGQLGFRQTPLLKEPVRPERAADRSFLTLVAEVEGLAQGAGQWQDIGSLIATLTQTVPPEMLPQVLPAILGSMMPKSSAPQPVPAAPPYPEPQAAKSWPPAGGIGTEAPAKILGSILPVLARFGPQVMSTVLPRLLGALRKGFESTPGAFGEAGVGGPEAGPVGQGIGSGIGAIGTGVPPEAPAKILGSILPVLARFGPQVMSTVLPRLLGALRKALEPSPAFGEAGAMGIGVVAGSGAAETPEQFLSGVLPYLAQRGPEFVAAVLPSILGALRKQYETPGYAYGPPAPSNGHGAGG